ncbi:Membrane protein involved in the export of O-antigen and teichoic acid [Halpernia humi]|uniref:Membrane protein involved in the export of O-antigen and teichoic acid n=1 Tax=Halpernia humi TaxID=493375 RepID=A0A1H5ULQ5_9FLAO|nr:oligosaccharide flippase family protein [Halpernia humi]SEF75321.1 Membrane protein involved in the export of O-antigen and teichoic acid [Halpernia humi]
MKNLQAFLRNFISNQGQYVFFSLFIAKVCAFAGSIFTIRLLPMAEFGTLSLVISVFSIFAAFNGMGSQQSLLRFGSMESDKVSREKLTKYLFKSGFYYQLLLTVIFLGTAIFFVSKYEDIILIFIFFGIRLIGFYFLSHIQSELRINGKNRSFALVNNVVNISGLFFILFFTYFLGLKGYLVAVAISPFIALFWYQKSAFKFKGISEILNKKEIWSYGFHASGTALMSDALFSADILLLGFMMNGDAVAHYKVALLIPANITFLAVTFMQSDFPVLAKNYSNKTFLSDYIRNYYKIFIPICILIFTVGFLFRDFILNSFFGKEYADNAVLFSVFLFVFCCNMLFRNLFGNLLSAVGKMKINTVVSFSALVLVTICGFILVPKYGILGMGFSLGITLLFTGLASMIFFFNYLKKLR